MFFIPLFSLLAHLSHSERSTEYLAFDQEFHFSFTQIEDTQYNVTFELWVPLEYYQTFQWYGIAIQDILDDYRDFRADYYIALTSDGLMRDYYGTNESHPISDESLGCTNDIVSWSYQNEDFQVYAWARLLRTGDPCDVDLLLYKPFMIKYAMGPVIDGEIGMHSLKYVGYEYFVLTAGYEDNNDDERAVYGPWTARG